MKNHRSKHPIIEICTPFAKIYVSPLTATNVLKKTMFSPPSKTIYVFENWKSILRTYIIPGIPSRLHILFSKKTVLVGTDSHFSFSCILNCLKDGWYGTVYADGKNETEIFPRNQVRVRIMYMELPDIFSCEAARAGLAVYRMSIRIKVIFSWSWISQKEVTLYVLKKYSRCKYNRLVTFQDFQPVMPHLPKFR